MDCEACGGYRLEYIGTLGTVEHFRCRSCGWTQYDECAGGDECDTECDGTQTEAMSDAR